MMSDPDPTLDDVPLESAVQAEAEAAEPEVTETRPPRPPLDDRTQLAVGAGLAVAIIGLLGSFFGAWDLIFGGLILITAGLVAAGAAYMSSGRETAPSTVPTRDLILAGGTIAAVFGILYSAEIVFALDIVDSFGGVLGLTLTFGLAIAGVLLYFAATQWWTGGPVAPWTSALASGDRATKLVLIGTAVFLLGWLGNVTIGIWFLRAGVEVITFILLAALVMRAAADPEEPLRLPLPPAFVALALSIVAAIIALQHTGEFFKERVGIEDWIAQLLYVAGVVVVVIGAGIGSAEGSRTLTEGSKGAAPPA
jgi:hypothetical protein